jgi:hypothetical protein
MTTGRTSVFATPGGAKPLDVSDFKPSAAPAGRPNIAEIDGVSRLQSREATLPVEADTVVVKRKPRAYRTGRNATLTVKTTPETVAHFYALADLHGWKAGETFEYAIAALASKGK